MEPSEYPTWICAGCGRRFKLKPGKTAPQLCSTCRGQSGTMSEEMESRGVPNVFQAPPETLVVKSRSPRPEEIARRRRAVRQMEVALLATLAVLLIAACLAVFYQKPAAPPPPKPEEIAWARAKEEIGKFLLAPKTAEFPETGTVDIWPDGKSATVSSFVDSQNANGVPIRADWKVRLKFDEGTGRLIVLLAELSGRIVYADPELQAAAEELQRQQKAQQTAATKERRERAEWKQIAFFDGRGAERTTVFETREDGFLLQWGAQGHVRIRLYDEHGGFIKMLAQASTRQGEISIDLPAGRYSLSIETEFRWRMTILE